MRAPARHNSGEGGSLGYRIFETRQYQKDLALLSRGALPGLEKKLRDYVYPQLQSEPHFGLNIKRLKGRNPPTWRYRIADWRFFFEINEKERIVFMIAASHRSEAY